MITVYSKPQCIQCNQTYLFLDKLGVDYVVVDISLDEKAMDKVIDLGFYQAPVVVVNNGEKKEVSWSGFRPDMISKIPTFLKKTVN